MRTINKNQFWFKSLLAIAAIFLAWGFSSPAGAQDIETKNTRLHFIGLQPSVHGNIVAGGTHTALIGSIPIIPIKDFPVDPDIQAGVDAVLVYYDIGEGKLYNTGAHNWTGTPKIWGDKIAFTSYESYIRKDLNGDGDSMDHVIRYFDVSTQKVFNTKAITNCGGSLCSNYFSIYGNIIAYKTTEQMVGKDLNGDGDAVDMVVRYYDIDNNSVQETRASFFSQSSGGPIVSGDIIVFLTAEREEGNTDLNGDGDANDTVLRYFDLKNKRIVNTNAEIAGRVVPPDVSGSVITFLTFEGQVGADLNGDGDTSDTVVRYFDVSRRSLVNTMAEVNPLAEIKIRGNLITFTSSESFVGRGQDLNGDGDINDNVLRYYDISAAQLINTAAEIFSTAAYPNGKVIAFISSETSIGESGQDLNGDGDTNDNILRYYDLTTKTVINTKVEAAISQMLDVFNDVIAFASSENRERDFNGDGDKIDIVLRYILLSPILPTPPLASFLATPATGEAPLAVNFTDTSTNNPTSWLWNFCVGQTCDNQTSAQQNPSHAYNTAGIYTVSLTVSNDAGSDAKTMVNLITVTVPDTTKPNVVITEPLDNAEVKDTIIIKANVSDNREVNRAEFYIDNSLLCADNTSPYECAWNTKTVSDNNHSLKAKAYDNANNNAEHNIIVKVNNAPINHPPILNFIGDQFIDEGQELIFNITASDVDNDPLTYSADNLPQGASFNPLTQTFNWTPNNTQSGTYPNVYFEVSDGKLTDSKDITITVNNVIIPQCSDSIDNDSDGKTDYPNDPGCSSPTDNDETDIIIDNPPTACIVNPNQTAEEGTMVILDGSCSNDIDNDALTYQWIQTSGDSVVINNSNEAAASFIAPIITISQRNNNNGNYLYASLASSVQIIIEFFQSIFAEEESAELGFQLTVTANSKSDSGDSVITVKPKPKPASVSIINPLNNQTVPINGKIIIKAQGENIKYVYFFIDNNRGVKARYDRKQDIYYYSWTVPYGYNQTHIIKAKVLDKQKNTSDEDQISVFTDSPPSISITNPQNNQTIKSKDRITIQAQYSPDNKGITKTEFIIIDQTTNKQIRKYSDRSFPYQFTWTVPNNIPSSTTFLIQAIGYSRDANNREIIVDRDEVVVRGE